MLVFPECHLLLVVSLDSALLAKFALDECVVLADCDLIDSFGSASPRCSACRLLSPIGHIEMHPPLSCLDPPPQAQACNLTPDFHQDHRCCGFRWGSPLALVPFVGVPPPRWFCP